MNRSTFKTVLLTFVGTSCMFFGLVTGFGDNIRRMFGASVNALANDATRETRAKKAGEYGARKNIMNFAAQSDGRDEAPGGGGGYAMGAVAMAPAAMAPPPPAPEPMMARAKGEEGKMGKKDFKEKPKPADSLTADREDDGVAANGETAQKAAPTRAWFPEAFLFQPLVVTDAQGLAAVNTPVPDRLTTWRVLALAHSAEGAQAGAVARFLGTLPAYVDPVVPGFLLAGDQVRLPVQVVNTTEKPIAMPLKLEAEGAELEKSGGPMTVPAGDSKVEYASLKADRPGTASLKATFGSTDAVVRLVPVLPTGQPVTETRGGTLAAPRTVELSGPADLDPQTAKVRLLVFPGALALLRSELTAASSRGGVAEDAYALLLAGRAEALLTALGDKADPEALRALSLVAGQRVIRYGRSPDVATAALLAEAASAHPESPVLQRLGERLSDQVARGQRPDGTFEGGAGWTLQHLLVVTADCVRAVRADQHDQKAKQRAAAVTLKASGAFERNLEHVQDGYTAAVILGSGAVSGKVADRLREKVRAAIVTRADGSRTLPVEKGTVRPDGQVPTELEATARAALALDGDEQAPWRADLGAALLGAYSPSMGWGDGATNLASLQAVLSLFKSPLPASVKVALELDGKELASGELSGARLRDVLSLDAPVPGAAGSHTFTVRADPPVPGLGYSLQLAGYVPWKSEANTGLELQVTPPRELKVGEPAEVALAASAPAGYPLKVHHALPAGAQAETASLDALVSSGQISRYHVESGAVDLFVPALASGHAFNASYKVVPTLAGTLHAPASTLSLENRAGQEFHLPPAPWAIH